MAPARGSTVDFNRHQQVALAQLVLSGLFPLLLYGMLFHPWRRRPPRIWLALPVFCGMRIVDGLVHMIYASMRPPSIVLECVTTLLFNIGFLPLLLFAVGAVRLLNSFHSFIGRVIGTAVHLSWGSVLVAFCLLLVGGALDTDKRHASDAAFVMLKVAWVFIAVSFAAVVLSALYFFSRKPLLDQSARLLLYFTLTSLAFMVVRLVYGFLYTFDLARSAKWNPAAGDTLVYGLMGVMPEFFCLFFFSIPGSAKANPDVGHV